MRYCIFLFLLLILSCKDHSRDQKDIHRIQHVLNVKISDTYEILSRQEETAWGADMYHAITIKLSEKDYLRVHQAVKGKFDKNDQVYFYNIEKDNSIEYFSLDTISHSFKYSFSAE